MNAAPASGILGAILAGGRGARFGGADKGWLELRGSPLVRHALDALAPQVDEILVVANRSRERYAALGLRVVADEAPDCPGPMAGAIAALAACTRPWLLTVPVDAHGLPPDLATRLRAPAGDVPRVMRTADGIQPMLALYPRAALPALRAAFAQGRRSLRDWLRARGALEIDFADWPAGRLSLDTPEQLAALDKQGSI